MTGGNLAAFRSNFPAHSESFQFPILPSKPAEPEQVLYEEEAKKVARWNFMKQAALQIDRREMLSGYSGISGARTTETEHR
ncbi:hypothetical protein KBB96_17490 [Luteolibacter ambystomatis]|uniref:Uncharacterized protein n=1 Tax=Luteolibacter ambystomatis TaxID=2824561 RepID=A0A975IYQ7_9BACT|nr:hypothetical protein [Luteolibacter ambystomatis]QUE50641.1 hypothetical protein KBB96_17490 [Luteolibacter ambystomatis]